AMSRVRSGAGLRVERWSASSIRAEPLVTSFYDSLAVEMERYVPRAFFAPIEAEAEAKREPEEDESYIRTMARASANKAKRRTADLLVLVRERASLQEMADATGYKPDRLPIYLEKLLKQGEMFSLHHLVEDVPSLGAIREAFEACGLAKLKPVYDRLREEVDYDTLRLVRCAMLAEQAA
nr:helix-turn-helix domain-containing protein [Candidatus Peribacteraceae bacterium]